MALTLRYPHHAQVDMAQPAAGSSVQNRWSVRRMTRQASCMIAATIAVMADEFRIYHESLPWGAATARQDLRVLKSTTRVPEERHS